LTRLDALDLMLEVLKEHEMALDGLVSRLEVLVDQLTQLDRKVGVRQNTLERYYQRE